MPSSILAARQALKTLLAAADDLADVQVTFGPPQAYEEPEVVAILGTVDVDEEPEQLGHRRTEETYGILVGIKVHQIDGDAETTADRAYELAEAVRATVHDNLTLTGTVRTALTAGTRSLDEVDPQQPEDGKGWMSMLRIVVECAARIT